MQGERTTRGIGLWILLGVFVGALLLAIFVNELTAIFAHEGLLMYIIP